MLLFLVSLALLGCVSAQENYNSFEKLRDAALAGEEITVTARSDLCAVTTTEENLGNLVVSMAMNNWQHVIDNGGKPEEIRMYDYYIAGFADLATEVFREIVIFEGNYARVRILTRNEETGASSTTMHCSLGTSLNAYGINLFGDVISPVDNYEDLKAALMRGDHIEVLGEWNKCPGGSDIIDKTVITVVHQIKTAFVLEEGTADEFMEIDEVAVVIPNNTAGISVITATAEALIIRPDNTVTLNVTMFNSDMTVLGQIELSDCQIGEAFHFLIHQSDAEATSFRTYQEVKDAVLSGFDMSMMNFPRLCEKLEGNEDLEANVAVIHFDQFSLYPAGGFTGEREFIAFNTYQLVGDGSLFLDEIRVFEDETVELELYGIGPTGDEILAGTFSCPLLEATFFQGARKSSPILNTFEEIVTNVQSHGQVYQIEVDVSECDEQTGPKHMFGGVAWQAYVDASKVDGYYYANLDVAVKQNHTGTPSVVWNIAEIMVYPDDSVVFTSQMFDVYTGENVLGESVPITCHLHNDGSGSVKFHKYP